ncbi:hypothetical protein [Aeromicrobium sp.]|uniref:hypothetical protein n=1 Tax=Aeromicrobium sp. TaxID=1871063 RepID=UPI0028A68A82|nr:hypothetical protein [Aeromicrobium sp.]
MSVARGSDVRSRRLWVLAAAAALTLTACSDDPQPTDPTTATPSSSESAPASTPTPTTEPTAVLPDIAELVVAPGRVGPVRAGMTRDEAFDTGLFDADVEVPGEGCGRVEPLAWKSDYAASLDVLTKEDGTVVSIGVRGEQPKTAEALGVGSTLGQVSRAYETAEMTEAGYGQTGIFVTEGDAWLGFLFNEDLEAIGPKSKVVMMEVTTGTRPDLMRDGC